jgi:hypothetical protein
MIWRRKYGAAIVYAHRRGFPRVAADRRADGRFHLCPPDVEPRGRADGEDLRYEPDGPRQVGQSARRGRRRGDVFAYFIAGAKVRNPAAAQALIGKLG